MEVKKVPFKTCDNPINHRPQPHDLERHHILPQSWGGKDGPKTNICGTCHNNIHTLLNLYVAFRGIPPWTTRRSYDKFTREMAQRAWEMHKGRTPYTLTHPDGAEHLGLPI